MPAQMTRASVNVARFMELPDVSGVKPVNDYEGWAGPISVSDNGVGVNGSIPSLVLQA